MLKLENISKIYRTAEVQTTALNGIELTINGGEFVAITGPSGCGKSTLLNVLGLVDRPSSGQYWFCGEDVARYSERNLTAARRAHGIGFVFQSFNLIDTLTVKENVEVPLIYRRIPSAQRRQCIERVLDRVGLGHRAGHMPKQLSGGQQQRVAVARALVGDPKLILADEPTGNLDTANGEAVMQLIEGARESGTTIVMVTHTEEFANRAQRRITLLDGHVVE